MIGPGAPPRDRRDQFGELPALVILPGADVVMAGRCVVFDNEMPAQFIDDFRSRMAVVSNVPDFNVIVVTLIDPLRTGTAGNPTTIRQ